MLSHPYAGTIYPVSRSASEVQGRKAYPSIAALPQIPDLAILIIPAQFVAEELERCGRAGVKAAVILTSGFAEEPGEAGQRMQQAIRATAGRYDMAVAGPNTEGFANIAAALSPTFSPAMDVSAGPLLPKRPLGSGQVSVISQSGGLGFAFFDRARGRNLASATSSPPATKPFSKPRIFSITYLTKTRRTYSCCCSKTSRRRRNSVAPPTRPCEPASR